MGIMGYENKFNSYLFNKTRRELLALLFGRPDEAFYVNQIVQRLNGGSGAVQRELKMMADAGIVVREKRGNLVYYQADTESPVFNELHSLVLKLMSLSDDDKQGKADSRFPLSQAQLDAFCRKHYIKKLSLFGSVLRDDFRPDSDIDVLVEFDPGHVPGFSIIGIQNELARMTGRKVDLRTAGDLSRYFRERVVAEARVKYDAK